MSVRLVGPAGSLSLPKEAWASALALGHAYGWKPAGTEQPGAADAGGMDAALFDDWDGRYFDQYGQTVTSDDARNLSGALNEALSDLSDTATPEDYFSGDRKSILRDLVALCRAGSFQIR
jgi:hypothetical protein